MDRWLIVYADLSVCYSDDVRDAYHVRKTGVLAIAKADAQVGRILITDCHHYCWRPGVGWFGVGRTDVLSSGLTLYLAEDGPSAVLFGHTVSNEVFAQAMAIAMTDPYLAQKSARHPIERFNQPAAVPA